MIARRHRVDCFLQCRHHRDIERHLGFLPLKGQGTIANVLAPHPNDIAACLSNLQQQLVSQPCPSPNAVMRTACRAALIGALVLASGPGRASAQDPRIEQPRTPAEFWNALEFELNTGQFEAAAGDFLLKIVCSAFLWSGAICLSPYCSRKRSKIARRIFCELTAKPSVNALDW